MARGNQKPGKALNISTREEDQSLGEFETLVSTPRRVPIKFDPDKDKELARLANKYIDEDADDPYNLSRIRAFAKWVDNYTGAYQEEMTSAGVKQMRQWIGTNFEKLPKDLQEYLEADRSLIGDLYRGASHHSNPGKDGKVYASFTTNKKVAEEFVRYQKQAIEGETFESEYPPQDLRVYTAADVRGFDRIIDMTKAIKLCQALREQGIQLSEVSTKPEKSTKKFEENEFLVTNIRWEK